ncbi:MerR family DNA-binding transcriptional regulator [Clostridium subterminale]|uniref:MerR family DNA-binding transcriptional regulator n=1 Tax=Clostridium subterminale TaxID=1550 RepID=UPI003CD08168
MEIHRTSEIAKIMGVHSNTVRLYEELKLIPKLERISNAYRIFHIEHFKIYIEYKRGIALKE